MLHYVPLAVEVIIKDSTEEVGVVHYHRSSNFNFDQHVLQYSLDADTQSTLSEVPRRRHASTEPLTDQNGVIQNPTAAIS